MLTSILFRGLMVFLVIGVVTSMDIADLNVTEKNDGTEPNMHAMEVALLEIISGKVTGTEAEECPSSNECLKTCPVGYAKDERGCPDCNKCATEGLFEGDIIVEGEEELRTVLDAYGAEYNETGEERRKRDALRSGLKQWPKEGSEVKIPYVVDRDGLGSRLNDFVNTAIAKVHALTCIHFVGRDQEEDYIKFEYDSSKCSSHVGRTGGKQVIKLNLNCAPSKGTVIHEIMHALGFWHEQSRPDRDTYVDIMWDNVPRDSVNFARRSAREWDSFGSPYDIDSIMQYGGYELALDPSEPTIINKATRSPVENQRVGFSTDDLLQINSKYECGSVHCQDRTPYCNDYMHLCNSRPALMGYWCAWSCWHC